MTSSAARLQAPSSRLVELLLREVQPGYERAAFDIGERWSALPPATFEGVDASGLIGRALDAAERLPLTDDARLLIVADIGRLRWWCGLSMSEAEHARVGRLVRRIFAGVLVQIQPPPAPLAAQPMAHALFVGSLVGPTHSPSRGAVDYAKALLDDPAVERVRICHRGPLGAEMGDYARERLGRFGARVAMAQDRDGSHLPHAIAEGPFVHHVWCEDPLALEIGVLSLFGPTIMFTCGDEAPLQYADLYWYLHEPRYIADLWGRRGLPDGFVRNYVETACGPSNLAGGVQPLDRAELGLSGERVVLATVGNRLAVDFDEAFVDGMAALLRRRPQAHWMVVGALPPYFLDTFRTAFGAQFSHAPYSRELRRLLTVADVFVNPFRQGGGDSAMLALMGGAVVLARGDRGDVRAFVPEAHRHATTSETFFRVLDGLAADPGERAAWRSAQALRTAELADEAAFTRTLARLSTEAFERYRARASDPLKPWMAERKAP